ncbi:MAG: Type 1 glutamine amidotransferase-like domain-containing protein [Anaerolineales bacterium]|nr:Type 1 glutamine amidotransferase-like domain-containing protein [Anaerolineales bacterium]
MFSCRSFLVISSIIFLFASLFSSAHAQTSPGVLLPIGGGYTDIYNGFARYAVANAHNGVVKILILPAPYATNAEQISQAERTQNLKDAEERRRQVEGACRRNAPAELTCKVVLLPLFTRSDAADPAVLEMMSGKVSAVFILGGDQAVAMQALIDTPAERRLAELHAEGTVIAGTSAGGAMQSRVMLAAYNPNYAPENALFFNSVEVWNTAEKRGLSFGVQEAIIDQHFQQRARIGRLISVITRPDLPHLGVGVDAYTGVAAEGSLIRDVFGLYTVTILDAETYHAADSVRYITLSPNHPPLISVRNILLTLLSPGDSAYNLKTRVPQRGDVRYEPAETIERSFNSLSLPPGAGALILSGDISNSLEDNPILKRFIELAGGQNANLLVIADGGASPAANERAAKRYADALTKLGAKTNVWVADANGVFHQAPPPEVTGFVFVGRDASKMTPPQWVKEMYWMQGKPILADNAAATLFGAFYAAHGPTPTGDAEQEEIAVQRSFLQGKTKIETGVGLLPITLQPQVLADKRFGRLFSLAYNHPDLLAIGLNANTALEITSEGARVLGENGIFVLDLRSATLSLGTNNGFVIFNGLLDVFAPGERVQPEPADVNAVYQPQPTPVLPSPEPTAAPTQSATSTPAASPTSAPTHTPGLTASLMPTPTSVAPLQPPASALPQFWGLVLGLLLILSAWLWSKSKKR